MGTIVELPTEAIHLIYSNLSPLQCVLLSQSCKKLHQAANNLPEKFKTEIAISVENLFCRAFSVSYAPAKTICSTRFERFEQRCDVTNKEPFNLDFMNDILKSVVSSNCKTLWAMMYSLELLLKFTSVAHLTVMTHPMGLFRFDWFDVMGLINYKNGHQQYHLILTLNWAQRPFENLETFQDHPTVEVARRVSLLYILWNVARTGTRSLEVRFDFSFGILTSAMLDWFTHLNLSFVVYPWDYTKNCFGCFQLIVMKFLDGGFKDSSFNFLFIVPNGEAIKKCCNPFSVGLELIRKELGQSETICYHKSEAGVNVVWRTMNKGQYRISWQGPIVHKQNRLCIRVQGVIDSDDAIPRTRQLTPALQRQMESAFRYTLGE